jgi:hypothetical protein
MFEYISFEKWIKSKQYIMELELGFGGCFIPRYQKEISKKVINNHINDLTLSYTTIIGPRKRVTKVLNAYRITDKGLRIPRAYAYTMGYKFKVNNYHPITISTKQGIVERYSNNTLKLDPNQQLIVDYILSNNLSSENVVKGRGSMILEMETGLGKSYIACYLLKCFGLRSIIVAPKKPIVTGWVEIFEKYFPDVKVKVIEGKFNGDLPDVAIMTTKTAYINNNTSFFKNFQMIVYDEVHTLNTEKYGGILWNSNLCVSIGLTATPDSKGNEHDNYCILHLGVPTKADTIPGYSIEQVKFSGKVYALHYNTPSKFREKVRNQKTGNTCTMSTLNLVEQNDDRFQTSLSVVKHMYNNGYNPFVFSEDRDYVSRLYSEFVKSKGVGDENDIEDTHGWCIQRILLESKS